MSTTAQAFAQFLLDIEPSTAQKQSVVPGRQRTAVTNLEKAFSQETDMPFLNAHLIGSAAKGTAIKPVDDIDILAVFSDVKEAYTTKYKKNSKEFLYRVREAYNGLHIQQVGARGQAVRIFFKTGGYVDVAPVFSKGDGIYLLPAGDGSWITTSPIKATEWFEARHRDLSYNLKPVVKLIKKWNRVHSSRFSSFHLETVVASIFSTLSTHHRDALYRFFDAAPGRLRVADPGGHSSDLSSYLSIRQRNDITTSLKSAADRSLKALLAEQQNNHDEAKRLWSLVLGDSFPR